jgi:hypothetical protein
MYGASDLARLRQRAKVDQLGGSRLQAMGKRPGVWRLAVEPAPPALAAVHTCEAAAAVALGLAREGAAQGHTMQGLHWVADRAPRHLAMPARKLRLALGPHPRGEEEGCGGRRAAEGRYSSSFYLEQRRSVYFYTGLGPIRMLN